MSNRKASVVVIAFFLQVNHPPVVKIGSPVDHSSVATGAQLSYQIQVTDPEDGDSRYDEINTKEVLLELTRLPPGAKFPAAASTPAATATSTAAIPSTAAGPIADPGLDIMASNNCFNCHLFKGKLLGPSFFDIANHYSSTKANIDSLIRRVRDGSAGIWPGSEKMPAHPELPAAAIRSTILWIMRNGAREDRTFYNGTTGLIRLPPNKPGTYILTASYTDHGLKDLPGHRLKGSDRIAILVK